MHIILSMTKTEHAHYDHYNSTMIDRLDGFFGAVDDAMNHRISQWIVGQDVLDIGCGFGSLVDHLRSKSWRTKGIDMLSFCIKAGRARFPYAELIEAQTAAIPFPDQSFDTVVLKDTLHHAFEESDVDEFFKEIRRVCRKRVVIFDPNPTWILLTARKIIGHVDPVCSPQAALELAKRHGLQPVHVEYSEVFAFPLSGGYVGRELLPCWSFLYRPLLALDHWIAKILSSIGLARFVCWRYLMVFEWPS